MGILSSVVLVLACAGIAVALFLLPLVHERMSGPQAGGAGFGSATGWRKRAVRGAIETCKFLGIGLFDVKILIRSGSPFCFNS